MFWICDQNSVANTSILPLLLGIIMSRFSLFLTLPLYQVNRPGVGKKERGGTQEGCLTLKSQRDIPVHMMSWSAIKIKKKKSGDHPM